MTHTPKMLEALADLPQELHQHFDTLVDEMTFCSQLRGNLPYRNWKVLCDLVRAGWRHSAAGQLPGKVAP